MTTIKAFQNKGAETNISSGQRFLSLDVFRGLTIFMMIIVNTPGPGAEPFALLEHADWFGITIADLIFPSFLFAVGNAMSFSIHKFNNEKVFLRKVSRRTILIFLIGFLMYWYPFFEWNTNGVVLKPFAETRIMGVLQRIALCYGFAALLVRYLSRKQVWIVTAVLLLGYWGILYVFGVDGQELSKMGNAGTLLDRWLLGDAHLYHGDGGVPFDPEGLLSTLPALVNVLAGYMAGRFIQRSGKNGSTIFRLLLTGFICLSVALLWSLVFPVSKKLWTSPFVFCTVGFDLVLLGGLLYLIEIKNIQFGVKFFTILGKNPLFIYLLSEILIISIQAFHSGKGLNLYEWVGIHIFQQILPGPWGSLICAIAYTMICWVVAYGMDKKRCYIKI